ncbi:hypothetical protein V8G54_001167 [Vigna mungo]|uniref:Cellulose synthase n=1 Tax=Vigna mungo TaxID=3915 RepID=A0AAQ3SAR3_VIGMU
MKVLDGIRGPVYVGTGCVFNRQALYGYDPPVPEKRPKMTCDCWPSWCCCCGCSRKSKLKKKSGERGGLFSRLYTKKKKMMGRNYVRKESESMFDLDLEEIEEGREGYDELEKSSLISFHEFTLMENGGLPEGTNSQSLIKEAIHVISCGCEEKTEGGKEMKEVLVFLDASFDSDLASMQRIGWIYGSVTEDILTGFKMHCRGWKSVYYMPKRDAFKGSTPINLSDRLHQVLRWALGSVEIFLSRHCPLWYGYGGKLKWLERLAYTNTIVYPFTSVPLLAYCIIPAKLSHDYMESLMPLTMDMVFFAFWVIVHLYPFLKGLMGRQNRTPTIVNAKAMELYLYVQWIFLKAPLHIHHARV